MNKILLAIILWMPFMAAHAVVVKINAEYSQSISKPGENEFRITDPCTSLPLPFFL